MKINTVKELISMLEKIENKDQNIFIALNQCNQVYPVQYLTLWTVGEYLNQTGNEVRIMASLPDNTFLTTRKVK